MLFPAMRLLPSPGVGGLSGATGLPISRYLPSKPPLILTLTWANS